MTQTQCGNVGLHGFARVENGSTGRHAIRTTN